MKKCNCDVPDGLHATCCGWVNAWVFLDDKGCINDERHPGHGQNYSQWLSQQTTPNPPRNNVEEKFNTYTDQSAYTPSYLLTDNTPSVEKSEGEEAIFQQLKDGIKKLPFVHSVPLGLLLDKYAALHSSGDRGRKEAMFTKTDLHTAFDAGLQYHYEDFEDCFNKIFKGQKSKS